MILKIASGTLENPDGKLIMKDNMAYDSVIPKEDVKKASTFFAKLGDYSNQDTAMHYSFEEGVRFAIKYLIDNGMLKDVHLDQKD